MTTLSEPLVTPKYDKWRQLVLGLICRAPSPARNMSGRC